VTKETKEEENVYDKWVFEVRGGIILFFGEHIELADGWWFSDPANYRALGPFGSDQEALDAGGNGSDIILCPTDEQLLVH
jgi:hypothetical protein